MGVESLGDPSKYDSEMSRELEGITSFDELYTFIENRGGIQGSRKLYTLEDMRKIIERVRHGHRETDWVTNAHGLRQAVERLLETDKVYKKYTRGKKAKKKR